MIEQIRAVAEQRVLFLSHAIRQMSRPERLISTAEVRNVIGRGEVIEDYNEDSRGHSCLLLGRGESDRPIHVVCSPKDGYLAIITAYVPSDEEWDLDYRKRRMK